LFGKLEGNRPLWGSVPGIKGINKMDLKSMVDVELIYLAHWRVLMTTM
jgi:hypothetical protein